MLTLAVNPPLTQTKTMAYPIHGEENSNPYTKHQSQRFNLLKTQRIKISNRD